MPGSPSRLPFVGRGAELTRLVGAYDAAAAGSGVLALVVGEPGIGKTTLSMRLAADVRERGGLVLTGHSYEEGSLSLPYLPFVEALRSYVEDRGREPLRRELGPAAPEIARIVPEVRDYLGVELGPSTDPESDRYRLFQAVLSVLRMITTSRPLLLVLEDLHDADRGTLDLLLHLARNLEGLSLLIVATYRDVEVDRTHPLSATLAALRRATAVERVRLGGLSPEETDALTRAVAGTDVSAGLTRAVHAQTEGNPLFVQETARWLVEEGRLGADRTDGREGAMLSGIPEGVRDVIGRRLSRLSGECNRVLTTASVIGREFGLRTVMAVAGEGEDVIIAALEEATSAGVLEEQERRGGVRYRFAHALFRQTLYEELRATRRIRLHQQVARTLEVEHANRLTEHAAELADHFAHSSDPSDLAKAVSYGEMAAQRAIDVYAYGEAVRLLEQALEDQNVLDPDDQAKRCDLLLTLIEALIEAGEPDRAVMTIAPAAFDLAQRLGDDVRASRVCHLALMGLFMRDSASVWTTSEAAAWSERADHCAPPISVARVWAETGLGSVRGAAGHRRECFRLQTHALEVARQTGDADALWWAAFGWIAWHGDPGHVAQRLRLAEELAGRPRTGVRTAILTFGLMFVADSFLRAAHRPEAEAILAELRELAERTGQPNSRLIAAVMQALLLMMDGALAEAVAVVQEWVRRGDDLGIAAFAREFASEIVPGPLIYLGRSQDVLQLQFDVAPHRRRPFRALCLAHLAATSEPVELLDGLLRERAEPDGEWTLTQLHEEVQWLETAVLVGHAGAADALYRRLADVPVATTGLRFPTCVARHLGAAAAMLGRVDEARQWYDKGLAEMEAMRFRPEAALVRLQTAELLAEHFPDERDAAREHLAVAIPELEAMGMEPAFARARALQVRLTAASDRAVAVEPVPSPLPREGTPIGARDVLSSVTSPAARVLATLLFTDIVGSTERTAALGDAAWRGLKARHHLLVREELDRFGGREVDTAGDGFFAVFDAPGRAVQCAAAITTSVRSLGLEVRAGLHFGEVEMEDAGVSGIAVHIGARVAALAGPSEVFVSQVVRDLVAGSGLRFTARGPTLLKGVPGEWALFALEHGAAS